VDSKTIVNSIYDDKDYVFKMETILDNCNILG